METIIFSAKEDEFNHVPPSNTEELKWRCGYNIGNWLFTSGVNNLLARDNVQVIKSWQAPIEERKKEYIEYSSRVLNVSNWIHPNNIKVFEAYTKQIKNHKIPTYLLGIGAQIRTKNDEELILREKDILQKFFEAILESGGNYTVRGPLTANLLEKIGLDRPFISGCPSMLGHTTPKVKTYNAPNKRILLHGDEWIYKYGLPEVGTFVDQTSLFQLCFPQQRIDRLKTIRSIHRANIDLLNSKSKKYLIPCNLSSWSSIIKGHSISIGTRIHGTLIALLNNRPAFLYHHDSRTQELAHFYGLPTAPLPTSAKSERLIQTALIKSNEFNFDSVTKRIQTIKKEFQAWSSENNTPFKVCEQPITKNDQIILEPSISNKEYLFYQLLQKI